jgi:ubiquinone/menaquinone biosynthesis C-methylase UbiE
MVKVMAERERGQSADRYRAAKVFDARAAEYDSWFCNSLVYRIELAALQSLPLVMSGPRLEIGVGPGHFARDLEIGFGLDPAGGPLRLAQQRGIKCLQGVGEELPLKDGVLGTIYVLFTLCFIRDPRKILAECSRVLREGGLLILGMIPAESKWGRDLVAKKEAGNVFYEHARFYTIGKVKRLLAGCNMSIAAGRSTLYQAPGQVEHA